ASRSPSVNSRGTGFGPGIRQAYYPQRYLRLKTLAWLRTPRHETRVGSFKKKRSLIRDVRWRFAWFQGQACSGEAALDEGRPVLDLLQAVPDDLDQVAEAGDGEIGQHAAFKH